jgi:predicted nucleotidyltransferase component of viral defense system
MIPKRYIDEWKSKTDWQTEAQIEQDLAISRALICIFSDKYLSARLAFRGGTAINKLFIKSNPRYSEDIDLVQINAEPIKDTLGQLRIALSFLGEPIVKQKANNNVLLFKFDSETLPIIPLKMKVEINCREHFSVLGYQRFPFAVENGWYLGDCNINTYHFEELIATKIRALFQRKKGRDLYDVYKGLMSGKLDIEKVILCFKEYMLFSVKYIPTQKQFILNLNKKIEDNEFISDIEGILHPQETFDIKTAQDLINAQIISKL